MNIDVRARFGDNRRAEIREFAILDFDVVGRFEEWKIEFADPNTITGQTLAGDFVIIAIEDDVVALDEEAINPRGGWIIHIAGDLVIAGLENLRAAANRAGESDRLCGLDRLHSVGLGCLY